MVIGKVSITLSNTRRLAININTDVPIPHGIIMHKNMRLYGKWMYERSDITDFIKLVENGILNIGLVEIVGEYPLEEWSEAWDKAAAKAGFGQIVLMKP